ncbi:hypothetical protein SSS_10038 [Sarcoptes scabiei]|nr:hypothetical protein SSS_10038 [Sarcoptes scabiei]
MMFLRFSCLLLLAVILMIDAQHHHHHHHHKKCHKHEVWKKCGTKCPKTCLNYHLRGLSCVTQCVPGCFCKRGFIRRGFGLSGGNGPCVPRHECHKWDPCVYYSPK